MFESFIESVSLLKSLELLEGMRIVDVIGEKNSKDEECKITQGDKADGFHIIESDEVHTMVRSKTETNKDAGSQEGESACCYRGSMLESLPWSPTNLELPQLMQLEISPA